LSAGGVEQPALAGVRYFHAARVTGLGQDLDQAARIVFNKGRKRSAEPPC
jgi:hypothetical protein